MQRKLFILMSVGMLLTLIFGLWLLGKNPQLLKMTWIQIKLFLVALLIGLHFYNYQIHLGFKRKTNSKSGRFLRWFNEIPVLFLFSIIILAVVKP